MATPRKRSAAQRGRGLAILAAVLFVCASFCCPPGSALAEKSQPPLQAQQGRYFRWSSPASWRVSESNAGVTLTSPDGKYAAFLATLMRSRGSRTPIDFMRWMLASTGCTNVRVVSGKRLPPQRMSYQTWQFIEATVSFTVKGVPTTAVIKSGVANYGGMNDAMIVGYQAASSEFANARSFMPKIAKSIVLTNAAQANGNDTIIHPKNNPLDNTATIKSWENRQRGIDQAMRNNSNARRGTVDLYDPSTGEKLNAWSQNTNYYWRKPGTNEVVGTKTYNPPGVGYVPLQTQPPQQGR